MAEGTGLKEERSVITNGCKGVTNIVEECMSSAWVLSRASTFLRLTYSTRESSLLVLCVNFFFWVGFRFVLLKSSSKCK